MTAFQHLHTGVAAVDPDHLQMINSDQLQNEIAPAVLEYCAQGHLLDYLRFALTLVHKYFPHAHGLNAEVIRDPDSGEEWAALTVRVSGKVEDIITREDQFVGEWIVVVPWPERNKIVVTLDII